MACIGELVKGFIGG